MKFVIKHEIKGRMRIHVSQYRMSYEQADTLLYFLHSNKYVTFAKVYERTGDAVIYCFMLLLLLRSLLCCPLLPLPHLRMLPPLLLQRAPR